MERTTWNGLVWLATLCGFLGAAGPAAAAWPEPLGRVASGAPELVLTFEDAQVVASELTPSGDAVFFSLSREPQGYSTRVVKRSGLELVDPFGEARFAVEGQVPLKSVWAAVDLTTGAFAIGAPPGFPLWEIDFPGEGFTVGAPGLVNRLRHRFSFVDMLVVRPGVGAWELQAVDAGPTDRDETDDDRTTTALEDMVPMGVSPPPPGRFAAGDVLIVMNPRNLAFYATRLIGPPPQ